MSVVSMGRTRLGLLAAVAVISSPAVALAVVPVTYPFPPPTPVLINGSAGDQTEPHVSGDWAAYIEYANGLDGVVRYYRFSTFTDAAIPLGPSAHDSLADVGGSRIVFSREITNVKTAIMVFDAATPAVAPVEIDPAPATRLGSAIGGDTVAYIDFGLHPNGELVIHDLAASTSVRITSDTAQDKNLSVSPDGGVVTWEHCLVSGVNCDIWQAVKVGGTWTVSTVEGSSSPANNPDTNGALVVYDTQAAASPDIFWRPVSGGAEVQLLWPGIERNPSIAGDYIAFEGRASPFDPSDLYVYDTVHNRLFRIIDTPLVNEELNDITLLPDGRLRLVWVGDEDGIDLHNIWSATFSLADPTPTPNAVSQINDLIALVLGLNLQHGIENSLDHKLQNILDALSAVGGGNVATACNKLNAFANEVEAQSGHHITAAQAAQLIAACAGIKATLGCP